MSLRGVPSTSKYDLSFNFSSFIVYILNYTSRSEIKLMGGNEKLILEIELKEN